MGAGKPQQAQRACLTASLLAAGVLAVIGLVMARMPEGAIALFCAQREVVDAGVAALPSAAAAQPFMAAATVMGMALRGVGRTRTALWTTLVCTVGLRLSLSAWLVLGQDGGLAAIWIASGCDWLLHALLLGLIWLRWPSRPAHVLGMPRLPSVIDRS